ncbi:DUF6308 family protein [Micromonospora sp. RP3T]|uniref:DUF6308 family protein n=1 Tax=Micromonospora sp. RP3T TaxID=2135446 RepID=UPI000D16B396|nr:DUF6308 family protein [Micromonospora sp. RP3T]PTA46090.1 hypothetical protein C8054_11585 [Micromonospora sp. RP3T]
MRQPLTLAEILAVLAAPKSIGDLRSYFHGVADAAYTGGRFDTLGGGGSRPEVADTVTAEDLIAVELLRVTIRHRQRLDLLQGQLGREVSATLATIPTDVELGEDDALAYVVDGGAADTAWRRLRDTPNIDWVIAGKLLARKRPRLVPVYDRVVACAYGTRKGFWAWLHDMLREDGGALVRQLDALHREAELPAAVSRLRVLDVVFWMRHRHAHLSSDCPGLRLPVPVV